MRFFRNSQQCGAADTQPLRNSAHCGSRGLFQGTSLNQSSSDSVCVNAAPLALQSLGALIDQQPSDDGGDCGHRHLRAPATSRVKGLGTNSSGLAKRFPGGAATGTSSQSVRDSSHTRPLQQVPRPIQSTEYSSGLCQTSMSSPLSVLCLRLQALRTSQPYRMLLVP